MPSAVVRALPLLVLASAFVGACTAFNDATTQATATLDAGQTGEALPPVTEDRSAETTADASDSANDASLEADAPADRAVDAPLADAACSVNSDVSVSLTIENKTTRLLNVFWVDYGCAERSYGSIDPGASFGIGSFATHGWRVRDAITTALVREIILTTAPTVTVTIQ